MKKEKWSASSWTSPRALLLLLVCLIVSSTPAGAQAAPPSKQGQSAIYQSNTGVVDSQALVDAKAFAVGDICATINYILTIDFLNAGTPSGVIVDARGITSTSPLHCSGNPFAGPVNGDNLSSTILLPAATIEIQQPWTIPSHTRVLGQSKNLTVLQACKTNVQGCTSNFSGGPDMIDMGTSTCGVDCQGLGIEHLTLDGNSEAVNGIVNNGTGGVASEELSYVNDVALMNIGGIGLWVQGGNGPAGNNSGPYSNIYFNGNGTCARINGTRSTRGIHGLTCVTTASSPLVFIDGSNNSIEDVSLTYLGVGPPDGIVVGSQASAQSNLLTNITGNHLSSVVHIESQASDLMILGVTNSGSATTIKDDLTTTPPLTDPTVGMYVVGEAVSGGSNTVGYSRFTTSPSVPTWLVGGGTPSIPCSTGSLYSNTSGPHGTTLSTCVAGNWKTVQ